MSDVIRPPRQEGVDPTGSQTASPSAQSKWWVLVATIMGSSMVFINSSTVNVALPALQTALGATVGDIQWIVNSYTLLLASLILLGGSLGDRFGRKRLFLVGVTVFTIASTVCGLVSSVGALIGARAVQGIGGALLTPGSLAIISATFKHEERGRAIGLWSGFSALTSAAGPLLGGWLIDHLSWRWIFFIHIPLAGLVLIVSLLRVPESRDREAQGQLDWWGAFLVTSGLGSFTYGLIAATEQSFSESGVWLSLVGGVILLGAFVWWEGHVITPMVPLALFRSRTFSGTNLLTLFLYTALGGALFFLPMNLIQVQDYSATAAGAALLPMVLIISLLSSWAGGLTARVGTRLPLIVGPLVAAAGYGLLGLTNGEGSYWTTYFLPLVVIGLGMAISVAPLTTAVMDSVEDDLAGTASGINNAVSRVASLLAVAVLGILMTSIFSNVLHSGLADLSLPTGLEAQLLAQANSLAAIMVPQGVDQQTAGSIHQTVNASFMTGFRLVAWVAAGLALLSAVVAAVTIKAEQPDET